MIQLKAVSKSYGALNVLDGIDLEVPDGSIFGIIGKSGAGKSTLLRIACLLEKPDSGEVCYAGERVDNLPEQDLLFRRRKMGMIFQNFNLLSSRDVFENIAYPLEIAGWNKPDIKTRVEKLLDMVEIADKRRARLRELSGGQKQRVAIARALAAHPRVLFCDEATSALDPHTTQAILSLIKNLHEKLKITVIVVTHQMEVIRMLCERVAVLAKGRVAEQGDVQTLWSAPKSAEAKEILNVK
ncbi:MAG: ATP-binding cassette domain-containing protein [Spirochaetaceae bacterium]|jgi:D-methionine transport system ATP-binding protein|nr:ATP-binding cassette domain-containing protein [Spirochaetaceae bacterium]